MLTANEASLVERAAEPLVFDPRNSFFPQTLLKAEDLRVSIPRPSRPRYVRYTKVVVAIALAIGAGLAYVFFLSSPATGPAAKDAAAVPAKEARSSASAVGAITGSSAATATRASFEPPKPVTVAPPPVAPAPVASVRRPAPSLQPTLVAPRQPPVSYGAQSSTGPRSTVTHTKAAIEAAESGKAAAPAAAVAAVVAPVAPPGNSRTGACSEAIAALGLCNPAPRGEGK